MPILTSVLFMQSSDLLGALAGLGVAALLALLVALSFLRGRRNDALEQMAAQSQYQSLAMFCGSLDVEKYEPGIFLSLKGNNTASRYLQFKYRWLIGSGRQAWFDEVTMDRSRSIVVLRRNKKKTTIAFRECSAVRMQEVSAGRNSGSYYHLELVPRQGRTIPFITSEIGERSTIFEKTASLAKAAATIIGIPVHVLPAGNVWTPGWPPKVASAEIGHRKR